MLTSGDHLHRIASEHRSISLLRHCKIHLKRLAHLCEQIAVSNILAQRGMEVVQGGSTPKALYFNDDNPLCPVRFMPLRTKIGIELRTEVSDGVWVGEDCPPILNQGVSNSVMDDILLRHRDSPHFLA